MKNNYEIRGNITAIFLNSPKYGNMETLIDTDAFKKADSFINSWYAYFSKSTKTFYVHGNTSVVNGKQNVVRLHRWLTNAPDNMVIDHKSHNGLDNTSKNLRICTELENAQNKKGACKNSKTGIRGVSWDKRAKKWKATIQIKRKQKHFGYHSTIEEAEKAVKKARREHMPYSTEASEEIA